MANLNVGTLFPETDNLTIRKVFIQYPLLLISD